MKEYTFDFKVKANSQEEAIQKMKGLNALSQILTGEQLQATVDFIKEKPLLGAYLAEKPIRPLEIVKYLGFWDVILSWVNPFSKKS